MPLSALTVILKQSVDLAQLASNVQRLAHYGVIYWVSFALNNRFFTMCLILIGPISDNHVSLLRRPRSYLAQ